MSHRPRIHDIDATLNALEEVPRDPVGAALTLHPVLQPLLQQGHDPMSILARCHALRPGDAPAVQMYLFQVGAGSPPDAPLDDALRIADAA